MGKFMKKPVEVEAWQLVEDALDKTEDYQFKFGEAEGMRIPISFQYGEPYLWCEKSQAWVDCPFGTFVIKEADGKGHYPYHDAAAFLRGHTKV
jgi:hypothetical protein